MKVCTVCHKELDESCFGSRNGKLISQCKPCRSKAYLDLYFRRKELFLQGGQEALQHRFGAKQHPVAKICKKCAIEKPIADFEYLPIQDWYKATCMECIKQKGKEKRLLHRKPNPKTVARKALLAEGKRICKLCGEIIPLTEMVGDSKKCKECERKIRWEKNGTEERLKKKAEKKETKKKRAEESTKKLSPQRELVAKGLKKCTGCGEILPLDKFTRKNSKVKGDMPGHYSCYCKKCCYDKFLKPKSNASDRLHKRWLEQLNSEYVCCRCGEILPAYKFGSLDYRNKICKKCVKKRVNKTKHTNARRNSTPYGKLVSHLRKRLKDTLVGRKGHRTFVYLGCTGKGLKAWLESQFTEGMTWENRGIDGWHIDHYVPICHFDMSKEEDRIICWNYRNLRPLWGEENVAKGNSLLMDYQEHINKIKEAILL